MSKQHYILVYFTHLGEKFKSKPRKKYKLKSRLIKRKQFHVQEKKIRFRCIFTITKSC